MVDTPEKNAFTAPVAPPPVDGGAILSSPDARIQAKSADGGKEVVHQMTVGADTTAKFNEQQVTDALTNLGSKDTNAADQAFQTLEDNYRRFPSQTQEAINNKANEYASTVMDALKNNNEQEAVDAFQKHTLICNTVAKCAQNSLTSLSQYEGFH
ncbi:MAG TPA: hypothetical protein V6C81_13445 [Planktothrix sp.]|jgi:hypothetical protein